MTRANSPVLPVRDGRSARRRPRLCRALRSSSVTAYGLGIVRALMGDAVTTLGIERTGDRRPTPVVPACMGELSRVKHLRLSQANGPRQLAALARRKPDFNTGAASRLDDFLSSAAEEQMNDLGNCLMGRIW